LNGLVRPSSVAADATDRSEDSVQMVIRRRVVETMDDTEEAILKGYSLVGFPHE